MALVLSLVLTVVRPAALPVIRTFSLAHLGLGVALSAVALSIRWNQTAAEMTLMLSVTIMVGMLANVPVLLLTRLRDAPRTSYLRPAGIFVLSLSLPILALLVWSQVNIPIVEARAMERAGTAPFCLQVADGSGYKQATRHSDLSGLAMQAPYQAGGGSEDYQFAFHAVLIVEGGAKETRYNWLYMSQAFVPVRSTGLLLAVECTPRVGFIQTLS